MLMSVALVAVGVSCSEGPVEALGGINGQPAFNSGAGTEEELTFTLPGHYASQYSSALPSFPLSTMMEITISGYIVGDGKTVIGPHGWYTGSGCIKSSSVIYTSGAFKQNCNGPQSAETVSRVTTVQGSGNAYVGPGHFSVTAFSGVRTFTLRIPRPKLELTASSKEVRGGLDPDTVRFRAAWSPDSFMGSKIPAQVRAWRWRADTDSQAVDVTNQCQSPAVVNTCKRTITGSGTMYVDARLNGRDTTASLRVEFVPCATGDPVLDSKMIRDSLVALLKASGYSQLVPSQRVEQGGYILKNNATGAYEFRRSGADPNATACNVDVIANYETGTHTLIAIVHSHPYRLFEQTPACGEIPSEPYTPFTSTQDVFTVQDINLKLKELGQPPISGYFIDGDFVVKYDESGNQTNTQYVGGDCPWSQQP